VSFSGTSSVSIFKPAVLRYVRAAASTVRLPDPFTAQGPPETGQRSVPYKWPDHENRETGDNARLGKAR
jgi:hypothetical protein